VKAILNLSVIVLLSSCAAWRLQKTEVIKEYSAQIKSETQKIKMHLSVDKVTHYLNGEKISEKVEAVDTEKTLNIVRKAYQESELFDLVAKDQSDLEIKLEVEIHGKSDMTMTILTAATLFLFPSKTTDEFSIKARFFKGGEEVGDIEKFETVTMYRQLFLIFALPFKSPFSISNETLVDLNRAIVTDAYDEGLFKQITD